jgi:hypothetical protein
MRPPAPDQIFAPDFRAEPIWWADAPPQAAADRPLPARSKSRWSAAVHFAMGLHRQRRRYGGLSSLGHQSALKILGRQNRPCPFEALPFPTHVAYRGRAWPAAARPVVPLSGRPR